MQSRILIQADQTFAASLHDYPNPRSAQRFGVQAHVVEDDKALSKRSSRHMPRLLLERSATAPIVLRQAGGEDGRVPVIVSEKARSEAALDRTECCHRRRDLPMSPSEYIGQRDKRTPPYRIFYSGTRPYSA